MKNPGSIIILLSLSLLIVCLPLTQTAAQKKTLKNSPKPAASKPAPKPTATPTPVDSPSPTPTPEPSPSPTPARLERLEVIATPSQIAIAAMKGGIERRNVVITANGPVEGINVIPVDLGRSDDRGIVIPATAIAAEPSSRHLASADDSLVVPLTFDLRGAGSGEFNGVVIVQYKGGKIMIPITVTIKDRWTLPLAIMAIGLGLSVLITYFRENGRPRDELLVRIGQLRTHLKEEPDIDEIFHARIEGLLNEAASDYKTEKWDEVQKSIELAEAVINRWHTGRSDWRAQLKYRQELNEWLKEFSDQLPPFLLTMRRGIEEVGRSSPNLSGPDKLQGQLDTLAQRLTNYTNIHNQLLTLDLMIDGLADQQAEWRNLAEKWRHKLDHLPSEDGGVAETLRTEVESGVAEIEKLIAQGSGVSLNGAYAPGRELPPLSPAPPASLSDDEEENTNQRVKWARLITYALILLLLATAGFFELYMSQPTFGASRWTDYFMLLAWGFGAEATRASVVGLMKNWGLPGTK